MGEPDPHMFLDFGAYMVPSSVPNIDTLGEYFGHFWEKIKALTFLLVAKILLEERFCEPLHFMGNSANGGNAVHAEMSFMPVLI